MEKVFFSFIRKLCESKKILILGFGLEGKSTANLLIKSNVSKFSIADGNKNLIISEEFLSLLQETHLGDDYNLCFKDYDLIFKSPGVKLNESDLDNFSNKITSQSEIFIYICGNKTLAVTGTKGKSTISSLAYHFLKEAGFKVELGGNIGKPLFDLIYDLDDKTYIVAELSCHQLQKVNNSAHIALLTNIFPEHLDYYKSMTDYIQTKLNVFKYQKESDILIYPSELLQNSNFKESITYHLGNKFILNNNLVSDDKNNLKFEIPKFTGRLFGDHNIKNQKLALVAVSLLSGEKLGKFIPYIKSFKPLEHRLELFYKVNNLLFINDSISTIPQTAIEAINSFSQNITAIFIGGENRSDLISYKKLFEKIVERKISNIFLAPDTGVKIIKELINKKIQMRKSDKRIIFSYNDFSFTIYYNSSLIDYLSILKSKILEQNNIDEQIILFSPAAPSYNQYKNFMERGLFFKQEVKKIFKE